MRTFLDENQIFGSTFLLYGNTNDDFYCPDASIRKMDQYLNVFLKSRGYEHVIFYGSGGTRGAYCLDGASARFFFDANHGLPAPDEVPAEQPPAEAAPQPAPVPAGGSGVDGMLRGGRRKRRYSAGALSDGGKVSDAPAETPSPAADPGAAPAGAQPAQTPPPRVTYSLKRMDVAEFYAQFREKMMDPDSRMAIVFYNVLTDYGAQNSIFLPSLKDDILQNFSQMGDRNLCMIVAPDTISNSCDLQQLLRSNGLGGKFLISSGRHGEFAFNPACCMQLGYPARDEIENMLHRFAVVGTRDHKRIRFRYTQLHQIAERILADASCTAQQDNNTDHRKMRTIAGVMEGYIRTHARGLDRLEITPEVIDEIWNIHADPNEAMTALNRKGWENAYQVVKRALRTSRNAVRQRAPEVAPRQPMPDLALERYVQKPVAGNGSRPPIPNFVILGSPGTGKTEIARLIGKILYAEGILKVGHTVEVGRDKLTDNTVAGVPKATMAQVDKAEEGVLFIDEAPALGLKDGGANHSGTGVEVVSTLNAAITDPNRHFCVILAGYANKMNDVFELDPGFRSRFKYDILIEDYPPDMLCHILQEKIRQYYYQLDPDLLRQRTAANGSAYIPLQAMVERIYDERDREKFGNGRAMKDLAEYAIGFADDDTVLHQENFYGGAGGTITEEYFAPADLNMSTEQILDRMNREFVGMDAVKEKLLSISLRIKRAMSEGMTADDLPLEPIVLLGNPGTGKTTVSNTLAQIYYSYGILGTPVPVVRNASDFASEHVGGTQNAVRAAIREAQNRKAFLFVDEAHQLCDHGFDGAGAMRAFMAPLTDRAHPFLACFGVYPHRKKEFLALDPGSQSRFENNLILLEDYTPEELYEIFRRAMERDHYTADPGTLGLIRQLMEREYETRTVDTGNARHALNILTKMKTRLDMRCYQDGIPLSAPESRHFIPRDIPEELRRGLSIGDNNARLAQLDTMAQELESYRVGNAALKEILKVLLDRRRFQLRFPDRAADIIEPGHYFFKGNAGTGKTTSLEFMSRFLCQLGIIKDPEPVKISASNLIAGYMGQTGIQTREFLEHNMGRVIMIDEAYGLAEPDGRANSFKQDAINEIVAKLDDPTFRKTTCVVFAGYEGAMDAVYAQNQGLKSRVSEIAFPDFTEEECDNILISMLQQQDVPYTEGVMTLCRQQLFLMHCSPAFSNGRTLRKYADLLIQYRNERVLSATDEESADPELFTLQARDIPPIEEVFRRVNLN